MGVDFGSVRIGIALSDLTKTIASPFEVYKTRDEKSDLEHLKKVVEDNLVDTIVFGLPINMDGTEGERALVTRAFAKKLEPMIKAKIVFEDERLSSVEAEELLLEANVRRDKRKALIDKISATIILEQYLNKN